MRATILIAAFITIHSKLFVYSPRIVREKLNEDIAHDYANFGVIPYGSTIIGRMYYSKANPDACSEYTETLTSITDPEPEIYPFVLAHRGKCSFVTKVRNIQKWGGRVAIIINNKALEYTDRMIMVDDGTGSDISIPSIIISNESGEALKAFYNSETLIDKIIVLGLHFTIEAPDDRVEYDLYYSLGDMQAMNLLKELKEYHARLGKTVLFTPHFVISESDVPTNCILGSKYCMPITDTALVKSSGKALLEEAIRQKCIYNATINVNNANTFFDYIAKIMDICKGNYSEECSLIVTS